MNFDLTKWQAYIAPIAAPAAPMILLGTGLYSDMLKSGTAQGLALIGASVSAAATEAVGALVCVMALEAFRRRTWLVMMLAIACAIAYAGIVYVGISRLENGASFGFTVFVSIIGYIGYGIWGTFQKSDASRMQTTNSQIDLLAAQAEYAKQQAKIANANARQAKAERGAPIRGVRPNSGEQANRRIDAARLALVVDLLRKEPQASITRICEACQIPGRATAKDYRELAFIEIGKAVQ